MGSGALQALEALGGTGLGALSAVLYYRIARRDSRSSVSRSMVAEAEAVAKMAVEMVAPLHAEAVKREEVIASQAAAIRARDAKIRELEADLDRRRGSGAGRDLSSP